MDLAERLQVAWRFDDVSQRLVDYRPCRRSQRQGVEFVLHTDRHVRCLLASDGSFLKRELHLVPVLEHDANAPNYGVRAGLELARRPISRSHESVEVADRLRAVFEAHAITPRALAVVSIFAFDGVRDQQERFESSAI